MLGVDALRNARRKREEASASPSSSANGTSSPARTSIPTPAMDLLQQLMVEKEVSDVNKDSTVCFEAVENNVNEIEVSANTPQKKAASSCDDDAPADVASPGPFIPPAARVDEERNRDVDMESVGSFDDVGMAEPDSDYEDATEPTAESASTSDIAKELKTSQTQPVINADEKEQQQRTTSSFVQQQIPATPSKLLKAQTSNLQEETTQASEVPETAAFSEPQQTPVTPRKLSKAPSIVEDTPTEVTESETSVVVPTTETTPAAVLVTETPQTEVDIAETASQSVSSDEISDTRVAPSARESLSTAAVTSTPEPEMPTANTVPTKKTAPVPVALHLAPESVELETSLQQPAVQVAQESVCKESTIAPTTPASAIVSTVTRQTSPTDVQTISTSVMTPVTKPGDEAITHEQSQHQPAQQIVPVGHQVASVSEMIPAQQAITQTQPVQQPVQQIVTKPLITAPVVPAVVPSVPGQLLTTPVTPSVVPSASGQLFPTGLRMANTATPSTSPSGQLLTPTGLQMVNTAATGTTPSTTPGNQLLTQLASVIQQGGQLQPLNTPVGAIPSNILGNMQQANPLQQNMIVVGSAPVVPIFIPGLGNVYGFAPGNMQLAPAGLTGNQWNTNVASMGNVQLGGGIGQSIMPTGAGMIQPGVQPMMGMMPGMGMGMMPGMGMVPGMPPSGFGNLGMTPGVQQLGNPLQLAGNVALQLGANAQTPPVSNQANQVVTTVTQAKEVSGMQVGTQASSGSGVTPVVQDTTPARPVTSTAEGGQSHQKPSAQERTAVSTEVPPQENMDTISQVSVNSSSGARNESSHEESQQFGMEPPQGSSILEESDDETEAPDATQDDSEEWKMPSSQGDANTSPTVSPHLTKVQIIFADGTSKIAHVKAEPNPETKRQNSKGGGLSSHLPSIGGHKKDRRCTVSNSSKKRFDKRTKTKVSSLSDMLPSLDGDPNGLSGSLPRLPCQTKTVTQKVTTMTKTAHEVTNTVGKNIANESFHNSLNTNTVSEPGSKSSASNNLSQQMTATPSTTCQVTDTMSQNSTSESFNDFDDRLVTSAVPEPVSHPNPRGRNLNNLPQEIPTASQVTVVPSNPVTVTSSSNITATTIAYPGTVTPVRVYAAAQRQQVHPVQQPLTINSPSQPSIPSNYLSNIHPSLGSQLYNVSASQTIHSAPTSVMQAGGSVHTVQASPRLYPLPNIRPAVSVMLASSNQSPITTPTIITRGIGNPVGIQQSNPTPVSIICAQPNPTPAAVIHAQPGVSPMSVIHAHPGGNPVSVLQAQTNPTPISVIPAQPSANLISVVQDQPSANSISAIHAQPSANHISVLHAQPSPTPTSVIHAQPNASPISVVHAQPSPTPTSVIYEQPNTTPQQRVRMLRPGNTTGIPPSRSRPNIIRRNFTTPGNSKFASYGTPVRQQVRMLKPVVDEQNAGAAPTGVVVKPRFRGKRMPSEIPNRTLTSTVTSLPQSSIPPPVQRLAADPEEPDNPTIIKYGIDPSTGKIVRNDRLNSNSLKASLDRMQENEAIQEEQRLRVQKGMAELNQMAENVLGSDVREKHIPLLPPNLATLTALKKLLLERKTLEKSASSYQSSGYARVQRYKGYISSKSKEKEDAGQASIEQGESSTGHKDSSDGESHPLAHVLGTHDFKRLQERFMSVFAWPALLSTIPPRNKPKTKSRPSRPAPTAESGVDAEQRVASKRRAQESVAGDGEPSTKLSKFLTPLDDEGTED